MSFFNEYLSIPGPREAPKGLPCIAFEKFDGSNFRALWSRKRGFCRFGTRTRLLDRSDPEFGMAIDIFLNKYGESIPKVLTDEKDFRGIPEFMVFGEFYGEDSFAGYHNYDKPFDVVLFDVNPYKKGILSPRQFVKLFSHLHIPRVVYEGNFTAEFINDVRQRRYDVKEGVVVKGNKPTGKSPHNYWCCKVKTKWWLEELKRKSEYIEALKKVLAENEEEQLDN